MEGVVWLGLFALLGLLGWYAARLLRKEHGNVPLRRWVADWWRTSVLRDRSTDE